MGIQPAMVRAAQGVERSEFKHDRLLKKVRHGAERLSHKREPVVDGQYHPSGTHR
jgi:hypothetical protein